jgi:SAM-dependent methyltransferase
MSTRIGKRLVSCSVCGAQTHSVLYEDELGDDRPPVDYNFSRDTQKTFQIVKCNECGFVYTNPMPMLSGSYVENVDAVYMASTRQRRATARASLKRIVKLKPAGTLLDVGCAAGLFLDEAAAFYQVEGLELSTWAADLAAAHHPVHRQPLSQLDLHDRFDVITLWGVIEHFEQPRIEMEAVFKALKPGGLVVIYTGDVEAWLPRLLKRRWWWFMGMHLSYFSQRTP